MHRQPRHILPGRYAAIDVGTNSTLLLVADLSDDGTLVPLVEKSRITRLGQGFYRGGCLIRQARQRTLNTLREYVSIAREHRADWISIVGTSVLRDAVNGPAFCEQVRVTCCVSVEVISGEQEAELTYKANLYDPELDARGPLACIDLGGGSTEIVLGVGERVTSRVSYDIGAVRLTERFLPGDPPHAGEIAAAEAEIQAVLTDLEPLPPGTTLVGSGGTIVNLASVALHAGLIPGGDVHGALLTHAHVSELVDLFASLPVAFRKRVPGLEPARADVILAGAMILHQVMARLSAPRLVASTRGVRHGCVYVLATRVPSVG